MSSRLVVDPSVLVTALCDGGATGAVAREALRGRDDVHAPHLIDVEITHALRGMVRRVLKAAEAGEVLAAALVFPLTRWGLLGLMPRVWELRDTVSAYAGAYVALAEALDAELLTFDDRLHRADGPTCRIRVPG
ncbi:MAG: type II toxin-antitoxin system VapC family toxin [Geodermatophilaceae bacterium]|nr:type II toxin-antitoxin system VapC family toxin [Geodermatophilaceae bacterium]